MFSFELFALPHCEGVAFVSETLMALLGYVVPESCLVGDINLEQPCLS